MASTGSSNGSSAASKPALKSHRTNDSGASAAGLEPARTGNAVDGDPGVTVAPLRSALPHTISASSLLPRISPSSAHASGNNSTTSSRESSPIRLAPRAVSNNQTPSARPSRQRGGTSPSPSRGAASTGSVPPSAPSSTAVQNTFSQQKKPDLEPRSGDKQLDGIDPDKTTMPPPPRTSKQRSSITGESSRSPGPGNTAQRTDPDTLANISSKRISLTPPTEEETLPPSKVTADDGEAANRRVSMRNAGSTLETVQEASSPSTPMADKGTKGQTEDPSLQKIDEAAGQVVDSGSDSGGNKSSGSKDENRKTSMTRPTGDILPKKSFTSLNSARGKPGDGSVRNMIVETETVSSIPQVSLGVPTGERGNSTRNDQGGTIRMKPSTETIRPKKEKKKTTRKPPTTPGIASSKADIFEAKVASAIDDADVSDSDETFVYESNPPEPSAARHRYHSRTPSTTSMASQADQFVSRSRLTPRDGHGVTGKRSMKFTNNYNSNLDGDGGELDQRSVSGRGDSNGHSTRHHHASRHGRGGAYPSLFDSDSPFPQTQGQSPRSPRHYIGNGFRQSRRGSNPRGHPNYRTMGGAKSMSDTYTDDFDADGADDERTPLVGSVRTPRSRNGRRPGSASMRQMEYIEQHQRNCLSRHGGCIVATFLILILIGGAATFLAALTRPLLDVHVTKISNVLASEQEIILDLNVNAINPNIFPIEIGDMDVDIFAQSRYVGSDKFWRDRGPNSDEFPRVEHSRQRTELAQLVHRGSTAVSDSSSLEVHMTDGGVDHGTDPIDEDPSGDAPTMLLGRVFTFDSPIIFDPSPWRRIPVTSAGEIRLTKPGNKTEEGGTERWERVLQHPFQLIVRGVVKYSLPLSSSVRSVTVGGKILVRPNREGDQEGDGKDDNDRNGTVHTNTANLSKPRSPVLLSRLFSA